MITHSSFWERLSEGYDILKNKLSFLRKTVGGLFSAGIFAWITTTAILWVLLLLFKPGLFGQTITLFKAWYYAGSGLPGEELAFSYYADGSLKTSIFTAQVIDTQMTPYWDMVKIRFWISAFIGAVPLLGAIFLAAKASLRESDKVSIDDYIRGAGAKVIESADEMNEIIDKDEEEERDNWARSKTENLYENEGVEVKTLDPVQFKARFNSVREQIVQQRRKLVDINIGGARIPVDRETQGMYIVGSPGSGKTVTQRKMMHKARKISSKIMWLDPKPELIAEFYRPGIDILLNPLGEVVGLDDTVHPSAVWTPWAEITELPDYFSMAEAIVTVRPDDKVPFPAMANSVIGGFLELTDSFKEFNALKGLSDAELEKVLSTTLNAGAIKDGWKTGNTIARMTLERATKVFRLLRDPEEGEEVFSINNWIKDDSDRRNVFISFPDKHRALLAPLITLWFDIAFRAMLDLQENNAFPRDEQRRVCFLLEELAALGQPIPMLRAIAERGRSFGSWLIITNQDPAQLDLLYTPEVARTIRNCCNTWLVFRCNDWETAEIMSKQIGEKEVYEKTKSVSSGADVDDPDGNTFNSQRADIDLVKKEEIMGLKANHGYLIMYGQYPKFKFYEPPMGAPRSIKCLRSRKEILVDRSKKKAIPATVTESGTTATVAPVVASLPDELIDAEVVQETTVEFEDIPGEPAGMEFQSDFATFNPSDAFGSSEQSEYR